MVVDSLTCRLGGTGGGEAATFVATRPTTFRAVFHFSKFRDRGCDGLGGVLVGRTGDSLADEFFDCGVIYRNAR